MWGTISSCVDKEQRDKPLQCLVPRTRGPPCSRPWYVLFLPASLCTLVRVYGERMVKDEVTYLSNMPLNIFSRSPSPEI